ncbi:RNA polymerase sigma factor [Sphingomonas sp.]|uniref:RNA polymerase sigma factor n=1 Tax=Sphingomonas sp. TaxID=28214 RepID=UPI003CC67FED
MTSPEEGAGGLRAVFLAERPMLLRLLAARLGSREEAEDAYQDLWLKLDGLADQPIAQPAAFLYRTAANAATDRRIAAARRTARDTGWLEVQPGAGELPDAERILVARDEMRSVQAVIDAMPDRMATALRLFRIDRRPQREIADELGISVSGVEKLLQRAMRIIHDRVQAHAADMPAPRRQDSGGDQNP